MTISFERASAIDAENLVKVQVAAFEHDAVVYPGVEIGGPPGYDSVESTREKIEASECYKFVDAGGCKHELSVTFRRQQVPVLSRCQGFNSLHFGTECSGGRSEKRR